MSSPNPAANWRRNAGFFIGGQFLSLFGSMLVQHAINWHITLQEQSGTVMALFTCAALLPMVFVSPFAGVWADRYSRKRLVVFSDAAIALVTLVVALLYFAGVRDIWVLFAAVMVRSVGQGVQQPAVSALIPQLVPEEHLARFNGIQSTAQSITMFAAPMAGGALLTLLPIEYIFILDVITAAIGIGVVFFFVRVPVVERVRQAAAGAGAYFREIGEGLRFLGGTAWLRTLFIGFTLFGIFAAPAAMLTPLQVTRTFGDDVWRLTAIELAFSIGMMAGGVAIAVWGGFKNKMHTALLALVGFGVTTVLFGVIPSFPLYLGVMVLCGIMMPIFNTPTMTLMQTKVPPEMLGRVFSILNIGSGLAMPVGMAVFGPLGDIIPIEWLLVSTGMVLLLGGLVFATRKELFAVGAD